MKPARPAAHITIAGRRLSAPEAALAGMSVSLGRFSHDRVRLLLWTSSKFASAKPLSQMKVELGTEDDETTVWTGKITSVHPGAEAVAIEGLSPTFVLSNRRKASTYLNQGAADVVRDLAGDVSVEDADTSLELDYYSVDTRRSVWGHLIDLARLAGAEITVSPTGGLRFVQVRQKPASISFRYQADLLSWDVGPAALPAALAYAAHGAASEAGKQKWHWMVQQAAGKPSQSVGGFHSRSAADALNTAASDAAKRAGVRGSVRLLGAGALRAGDTFKLKDVPGGGPGDLRALSLEHHFSGTRGCWTDVAVEGAGGGAPLGGLL